MAKMHTYTEASTALGIPRYLVDFLVRTSGIRTQRGPKNARLIDEAGMRSLEMAVEAYELLPDPDTIAASA